MFSLSGTRFTLLKLLEISYGTTRSALTRHTSCGCRRSKHTQSPQSRSTNPTLVHDSLISLFTDPNAAPSVTKAKQSLLKYHSLLSYSNIFHSSLWGIIPDPSVHPTRAGALGIFARQLLTTVLHPRFILFLPTFVLHAPAYATGLLADRLFRTRDWEETRAQFKAIFGGVAASAAYAGVTASIVRRLVEGSPGVLGCVKAPRFTLPAFRALWTAGRWFFAGDIGILSGKARAALGVFGVFYATSFLLSRWHNYWVGCMYSNICHRFDTSLIHFPCSELQAVSRKISLCVRGG